MKETAVISQSTINVSQIIDLRYVIQGQVSFTQIDIDSSRTLPLVLFCLWTGVIFMCQWFESSSAVQLRAAAHLRSWCFIQFSSISRLLKNGNYHICWCVGEAQAVKVIHSLPAPIVIATHSGRDVESATLLDPLGPHYGNAASRQQWHLTSQSSLWRQLNPDVAPSVNGQSGLFSSAVSLFQ